MQLWWQVGTCPEQRGRTQAGSIPPKPLKRQEQARAALSGQCGRCCQLHAAGEEDTGRVTGDKCLREDSSDKGTVWMR